MLAVILSVIPSPIAILIRRLMGAKIGKGVKLGFGAMIFTKNRNLFLGNHVHIKPFSMVKASTLSVGDYSSIATFARINLEELRMGKHTSVEAFTTLAGGKITMGDHSRIFQYCFLDASRTITIGKRVGIGGHNLIFTHGSWSNFMEGAPVTFGEVVIEDNVWLPWRVFILPNVVIGKNSIIGANSLVNKSIPENALAVGSPAVVIKENILKTDPKQRIKKALEIVNTFKEIHPLYTQQIFIDTDPVELTEGDIVFFVSGEISETRRNELIRKKVNLIDYPNENFHMVSDRSFCNDFLLHLTMYGVRLYKIEHE